MLGILCGLSSEARIASTINEADVVCAGARPQKARWLARELIRKGATRLLSFGVAGGLEPGLPIGAMVVGTQASSLDRTWECDVSWRNELVHLLPEAHCGGVWGSEKLVPTAGDKRSLYERSRCLIVDMESQCVAQIAAEAQIPFAIVRTVCDRFDMNVPPVVMAAIKEDGRVDVLRALGSLLREPRQIAGLWDVGKGMSKALKTLRTAAAVL